MLINESYKFLFVHIQKTAGTSITSVLSKIENTKKYLPQHSRIIETDLDFNNYYKFCFVRNPWDRIVSWYNMHIKLTVSYPFRDYLLRDCKSFSDYIRKTEIIKCTNTYKSLSFNQIDYMIDKNGIIQMDYVGKFENIDEDFKKICVDLNLPQNQLPHTNKFNHTNYREYYNEEDKEFIGKLYKRDIDYFDYSF